MIPLSSSPYSRRLRHPDGKVTNYCLARDFPKKKKRQGYQQTRHPIYSGVRSKGDKWVAELKGKEKRPFWLGTYCTDHEAALAHDGAALALRLEKVRFNFDQSTKLTVHEASEKQALQEIAKSTSSKYVSLFSTTEAENSAIARKSNFGYDLPEEEDSRYDTDDQLFSLEPPCEDDSDSYWYEEYYTNSPGS